MVLSAFLFDSVLLLQSIPGIPPVLVSGNNARPIREVADSIWRMSGLLFLIFTIVGIKLSQYSYFAKKSGGPGQYVKRCMAVGLSLGLYKVIFAGIMLLGGLLAFQIFPLQPNATKNTIVPWLPAGTISSTQPSANNSNSNTNNGNNNQNNQFQISSTTSVASMIAWGIQKGYEVTFQALPAMLLIALCNILFVLAIFLITAFWLTFAVILYSLGPLMIIAGLIPEYGEKLWGNWVGATVQCSLWQVWMAFCGKLITSSFFIQVEQLNPMNRTAGSSGGGELSTAVMDMQQASYALVFLVLYAATPLVANYIFPLGASAGLGAFMLTAATGGMDKVMRAKKALASGGTTEALKKGSDAVKSSAKSAGSAAASQTTSQRPQAGAASTQSGGGSSNHLYSSAAKQGTSATSGENADGGGRSVGYEISGSTQSGIGMGSTDEEMGTSASRNNLGSMGTSGIDSAGTSTSFNSQENNLSGARNSSSEESVSSNVSAAPQRSSSGSDPFGNNDFRTDIGTSYESIKAEDLQTPVTSPKVTYVVSNEKPSDIRFGNLPQPKNGEPKSTAVREDEI